MSITIFFCYAHEDEPYLNKLKAQLHPLQRQGLIDVWYDRDISAGMEWDQEINKHLNEANIILLLVSPDFMDSDYIYGTEMKRALEGHQRGEARVIPIILRPVYWQGILGHLQALPKDGLPVTDPDWYTLDRALYNVAEGIRKVVAQLSQERVSPSDVLPSQASKRGSADAHLTILSPQPETKDINPSETTALSSVEQARADVEEAQSYVKQADALFIIGKTASTENLPKARSLLNKARKSISDLEIILGSTNPTLPEPLASKKTGITGQINIIDEQIHKLLESLKNGIHGDSKSLSDALDKIQELISV